MVPTMTGAIGFCAEAIRGADICPAAAWLPINIPSSRIKRLCITRFPGRLILAFHFGGEGTDFAPVSKFLSPTPWIEDRDLSLRGTGLLETKSKLGY